MHDYNLAWGLAIHTRFDDLDLISRSQVSQNYKLIKFTITLRKKEEEEEEEEEEERERERERERELSLIHI